MQVYLFRFSIARLTLDEANERGPLRVDLLDQLTQLLRLTWRISTL